MTRRSPRRPVDIATAMLALCLAGCAAQPPAPVTRIAVHPAGALGDTASTSRPTEALPIDEPGRITRRRGPAANVPDALSAAARLLQPEALRQGTIAIDRPADDRLSVRIALSGAFNGPDRNPNPALNAFFSKVASVMQRYDDLCTTLAENRATSDPRAAGPRPYPRAAAFRRVLIERGIAPGRMAVELEAPLRATAIPQLPGEIEEGSIALSLHPCG